MIFENSGHELGRPTT